MTTTACELLGPALASAFESKGYFTLTPVQEAVLAPELAGRDLRISSQTGSGKTVALGLTIRDVAEGPAPSIDGKAIPRALVVTPTRELARQVEAELSWLFQPLDARVVSVTGGASYRDERRALKQGPSIVVGTPGRLLDHLERSAIDPSALSAVVLDEADRMLDMGFRDAINAIFDFVPEGRRTHLVSATFPREVKSLADRVQSDPALVEGTPLGTAHTDIEHVIHLVSASERLDAMVNLLLASPEGQTLIFARTRIDVADITKQLADAGFRVSSLSGEMEQRERNRALLAFKRGELHALVATDVAARGIDVQDIARVIHVEPPSDPDSYTHRSGRTGRAGRKGTSLLLVTPAALARTRQLLSRAGVRFRFAPIPTAKEIRDAHDAQLFDELTKADAPEPDARELALARRLFAHGDAERVLARMLTRAQSSGPTQPREVTSIAPPEERARERKNRREPHIYTPPESTKGGRERGGAGHGWTSFRVSWGSVHGADSRRLLAMVCRRGGIRGSDVGVIDIQRTYAIVDIAAAVAKQFAKAAVEPDPRDPRVVIREFHAPHRAHTAGDARPKRSPKKR
ncbi:MAG: DEAD/DEAH box helicase [Polyangiaceae bacterium]|nr:DEAD/DEAH box helicase [Polyangiaceae bacterium]